jgi:hypothetical protein
MKKINLLPLLIGSAIITGVITYFLLKIRLSTSPIVQFMPLILYAIALLVFFAKPLKQYYQQWSGLFGTLTMTWLLAMTVEFLLCYNFPPKGMLPDQWTISETIMLYSVQAAFAVGAALITGGIIRSTALIKGRHAVSQ